MPRTIVITGASSGVGLAAAEILARRGDEVVLVGRDPQRLAAAVSRVRQAGGGREPGQFRADFENLGDVRGLAEHLLGAYPSIDVLANNAGLMAAGFRRTPDGFESSIQANHLAPFLLTSLLRERLRGKRVVNTSSDAHKIGSPDPDDLTGDPAKFSSWRAYGESKAANILFTQEAARRWPDIESVAFHPGVVRTNFGAGRLVRFFYKYSPFLTSPEKAGDLLAWLCTASGLANGGYYVGQKQARSIVRADAARFWTASEQAVSAPGKMG